MRTAITIGKNRNGKWELIHDPDVPLTEQLKNFRARRVEKSDEKFSLVQVQESDGLMLQIHLATPEAAAGAKANREKEVKAALVAGEEEEKRKKDAVKNMAKERADAHAAELERLGVAPAPEQKEAQEQKPAERGNAEVEEATGLRLDGPTPEQWVEAGYPIGNYPPKGYKAKPSAEAPAPAQEAPIEVQAPAPEQKEVEAQQPPAATPVQKEAKKQKT